MTGWYPHVHGHRTMTHMLHTERNEPTLLKILKDNGYFVWWSRRNDLIPADSNAEEHCDLYYFPKKEDVERWGHMWHKSLHVYEKWRGESRKRFAESRRTF